MTIFQEIKALKKEGKVHDTLLMRTRLLFLIALILLLVIIFNMYVKEITNYLTLLGFGVVGFLLGFYILSQMSMIKWDEEDEVERVGNMDAVGFSALGFYILFEIGLRTFLSAYFPPSAPPLLLAVVFGIVLGRALGTLIEIHKVYLKYHTRKQDPFLH